MNTILTKLIAPVSILRSISGNKCDVIKFSSNIYVNNVRYFHLNGILLANKPTVPVTKGLLRKQLFGKDKFTDNLKLISSTPNSYMQEKISSLQIKKRPLRKKRPHEEEDQKLPGLFDVIAFATAEEYKLEELIAGLKRQNLYDPKHVDNNLDVVHAVAKYQVGDEPRELFFFREGTVVMWNITELESSNVLSFLRAFEQASYSERLSQNEAEFMNYKYLEQGKPLLSPAGEIVIPPSDNLLEKYTFSNAMALSVKLAIWEASLERYIDTIEFVTEDLKHGKKIKMSQEEVLRKHGELFALRHVINLSSDLLDTPDFYWDRDQLEVLYSQICTYFSIARRTRVINEKINHCVELIELLSSHLSDKHHVRLEWMIIILIMVEVGFEIIHYVDRFMH